MQKNIKYIVLNNGLELIGNMSELKDDMFELEEPFRVFIKPTPDGQNVGVSLVPYLPMVKDKLMTIRINDLLHLPLEPAQDLYEYYVKTTSNIILPDTRSILNG